MADMSELDRLIEENLPAFEAQQMRRRQLSRDEREEILSRTLGPPTTPAQGENFVLGDISTGITSKSVWLERRRIHFAVIVSIAVGEIREKGKATFHVDLNCTADRSYRVRMPTILQADNFLVGLSQFMSFRVVPTAEEQLREQLRAEDMAASKEARSEQRQRRMEYIALRQAHLLENLIEIESAPRISYGFIYG